jgi:D-sedoheptulose 7-phosphate isomerase
VFIDFENIEEKCREIVNSDDYQTLVDKVRKAKKIYLLGNGGLHFVAGHMSTDMTRLIPDKVAYSFDSVGFITSNANDHGFNHTFIRWLDNVTLPSELGDSLVVGMSCSGNSTNIINTMHWAHEKGYDTFMISGQKSEKLRKEVAELSFECEYFHTVEVLCMMIFYEMIHRTDNKCPSIKGEKVRLKDSPLRNL